MIVFCGAYSVIRSERIHQMRQEHPRAKFLMHPECGCTTKSMQYTHKVLSTEGMVKHVNESPCKEFIVATETGILHRMRKDNPEKKFFAGSEQAVCSYMKQNTLEKVVLSLEQLQFQVKVPKEIARRARLCLDRMVAIG